MRAESFHRSGYKINLFLNHLYLDLITTPLVNDGANKIFTLRSIQLSLSVISIGASNFLIPLITDLINRDVYITVRATPVSINR